MTKRGDPGMFQGLKKDLSLSSCSIIQVFVVYQVFDDIELAAFIFRILPATTFIHTFNVLWLNPSNLTYTILKLWAHFITSLFVFADVPAKTFE